MNEKLFNVVSDPYYYREPDRIVKSLIKNKANINLRKYDNTSIIVNKDNKLYNKSSSLIKVLLNNMIRRFEYMYEEMDENWKSYQYYYPMFYNILDILIENNLNIISENELRKLKGRDILHNYIVEYIQNKKHEVLLNFITNNYYK